MKSYSSAMFVTFGALMAYQSAANESAVLEQRGMQEPKEVTEISKHHRMLVGSQLTARPVQTFFVPLPETSMYTDVFFQINPANARAPIVTLISVAISTDNTIVWYDHWEDGYDLDVGVATATSTEIWGDGNAANGCAPGVSPCTNANDKLMAGSAVVIQNSVQLPRIVSTTKYDGGDRIQTSFPVSVVRGAYPEQPGSVLAGSVEVLDTTQWGFAFEAPVGMDVVVSTQAFELSAFFYMAGEDNTTVTHPDGIVKVLNKGQGSFVKVNQANRLVSNKPIQVDLITGDIGSDYEIRWFSLRANQEYSNSYVTPVGDTFGRTKVVIYNPGPAPMTFNFTYLSGTTKTMYTKTIIAKQAALSNYVPMGSGAWIDGNSTFIALSWTDAEDYSSDGAYTGGQWYDWGFPLVARNELTSQVLIGLGFACTNDNCQGQQDRSVVWISPVADADIYVDYGNTGSNQVKFSAKALQSIKITDPSDHDMSGAVIFALQMGSPKDTGLPVDIAAAWGQDPSVSHDNQAISLDMGTVVLPYSLVKVTKLVDKVVASLGDQLVYTIRVSNVGQKVLAARALVVKDVLDPDVTYISGSATFISADANVTLTAIPDDTNGTKFPLDDAGFTIPVSLPRRGGTLDITFKVQLANSVTKSKVINTGKIVQLGGGADLPFQVTSSIDFGAAIAINNTVYRGSDGGTKCGTSGALKYTEDYLGSGATYCFQLTNMGRSYLSGVTVSDAALNYTQAISGLLLAPGASKVIYTNQTFFAALSNLAVVAANPVFSNGQVIPDLASVTANDTSAVGLLPFTPSVSINNTVYLGNDNGVQCGGPAAVETVKDIYGSNVTYCFTVLNTGNTYLGSVVITDKVLNFSQTVGGILAPGQSKTFSLSGSILGDLNNMANATANPVLKDGTDIASLNDVTNSDPSAVQKLCYVASIQIDNTVYLGRDNGSKCGTPQAVEYVADYYGANVTYCFKVINTGGTYLNQVVIVDDKLSFKDSSIGTLAPGASAIISQYGTITGSFKNVANVNGHPITSDGRDIRDLVDVTASDPSEIGQKQNAPGVKIENTIYLSRDGGRSCGTDAAKKYVEDFPGSNVTYCLVVKNIGDTYLDSIRITDGALAVNDTSISRLQPGVSASIFVEKTIAGKLVNNATVTANPTLKDGTDIPNQADVTSSDNSSAGEIAYVPTVKIANTVYLGDDAGNSCPKSVKYVENYFGSAATYCFNVTNTGNTFLKGFVLNNVNLTFNDQSSIQMLAPGASAVVSVPKKITAPLSNVCQVTANPCKQDGTALNIAPVTNTDPSAVGRLANKPVINIVNTVYIGNDGGASCGTGKANHAATDLYFTDVTYCLNITNTGDTYLGSVVVSDKELAFSQPLLNPLAPGEWKLISRPGKIKGDLTNTGIVQATPILKDGTIIMGVDNVTSSDASAVKKITFAANVKIDNTVYLGNSGRAKCDTADAVETAQGYFGSSVTFCLKVTNTGGTYLNTITLSDESLFYVEHVNQTLAPNASLTVAVPSTISASQINYANVTANPITADGREILDLDDVKDSDPSGVNMTQFSPRVLINNTVYLGNDGGAKCGTAGVELVQNKYGSNVTYCFKVTNAGDTSLDQIVLVDGQIGFNSTSIGRLAAGGSATISAPGKIKSNLTNTATVTALPVLADGSAIPKLNTVTASDPSSIGLIAYQPSIHIENTVYLGNDGGKQCGTSAAVELVQGYPNTNVTYCFAITNGGDSYLNNVVIGNPQFNFTNNAIKLLATGDSVTISLPGTISGNLSNVATVTAHPVLQDGTDIPNAADVNASDPSAVKQADYSPKVLIDNTVYLGRDGGKQCGTNAARHYVEGMYGTNVTYCFTVTNLGDTTLSGIRLENQQLQFTNYKLSPLAPGLSVTVPLENTIVVGLKNTAIVTATPVTKDLQVIPSLVNVTSQDFSQVGKLNFTGGVKIENTVYRGDDGGAKCGTGLKSVEDIYGTLLTFCFKVTNTGDTFLDSIVVSDNELGYKNTTFKPLAPGSSTTVSVAGKIVNEQQNVAIVTANPVTASGQDIPDLADVTNRDTSGVKRVDIAASVKIANTVYLGNDGGKQCGTQVAGKLAKDYYRANVTYCFEVTNTGQSFLNSVMVENTDLVFVDKSIGMLAPGATKMLSVGGTITGQLTNLAKVTGSPCLKDGTHIPDVTDVVSNDSSGVTMLPYLPSVNIVNTVYLGNDNGLSCGTALHYAEHYSGYAVTYCLTVTNNGNSYLNQVVIVDSELPFTDNSIGPLAPGQSATVIFPTTIKGDLKNNAVVTANPTLQDGTNIPNVANVTNSDRSAVGQLHYSPNVKIENTVYLGDDKGASCSTGVQKVVGDLNASVTYCLTVTNTGDTNINQVIVTDAELGITDNSIGQLAAGQSKLISFPKNLAANSTNNAVVNAIPCLQNGASISGASPLTAQNTSSVEVKPVAPTHDGDVKSGMKPAYSPPDGPQGCLQNKWKDAGKAGDLICATKEVYLLDGNSLAADKPLHCKSTSDLITISVNATIRVNSPRSDLGWYVAVDGGDALLGTCAVNGLQQGTAYPIMDTVSGAKSVGSAVWGLDQNGDGDVCGDVIISNAGGAQIQIPFVFNATLPCTDTDDDGNLDFAVCFTWRSKDNNGACTISNNIPGDLTTGCYCSRYNVNNVNVAIPVVAADSVKPC